VKQVFTCVLCAALFAAVLSADAFAIQPVVPENSHKSIAISKLMDRLGTGTGSLLAVRLTDNSVVSGYVARADADSVTLADLKTGQETTVIYAQVSRLQGYNLVTGTEVHQGTGIRAKLVRGLHHLMPIQPVQQNSLRKGTLILVGIVVLVAIILAVELS
jgi:hypothetical protein